MEASTGTHGSAETRPPLFLGSDLLKRINQRIIWHDKVIRYSPVVKHAINHLKEMKKADDDRDVPVVFQVDIQYAIMCGQARVVAGSEEQCLGEPGWCCTIQGPTRSGDMLKVGVFIADDESELVRIDSFLIVG